MSKIKFIREVRRAQKAKPATRTQPQQFACSPFCIVRSDCYGSHLDYIHELVKAARVDFPDLQDEDIEVIQFGGRHYKNTFGIQFRAASDSLVPASYREINELEFLL